MRKIFALILLFTLHSSLFTCKAQTVLFHTVEGQPPYRIPAIATAKNGDIIALSDYRPCGNDIGFGRVDIMQRVSHDNGKTWGEMTAVAVGTGEGKTTGYGDACLVADRERNELLLVCVAGDVNYWKSTVENPQRFVTRHAYLNQKTGEWVWDKEAADLTDQIYHKLLHDSVPALFMGSGRICQSSRIKVGNYFRIYGALCTHAGNFVLYSDDFGRNWNVLGDSYKVCVPKGDEPKCEELPNGDVVISSRKDGGRYFNVFHYINQQTSEGGWGTAVDSRDCPGGIKNEGTPCNGEIMIVKPLPDPPLKREGTYIALQSIPAGPKRSNVTIYYKVLNSETDYRSPEAFGANWTGSYQVSNTGSAYSTMTLQKDGKIGFYYEEEPQYYQMVYVPLTIEQITRGTQKITGIRQINNTAAEVMTKDGGRITIDFYGSDIFRMFEDPNGGEIRDPEANPPAQILVDNPRRSLTPGSSFPREARLPVAFPKGEGDFGLKVSEDVGSVSIKSATTAISFDKASGLFTISKDGKTIVSQTRPTEFTRSKYTMYLSEGSKEYYYGGGVQNGRYSHRGEKIEIVNTNSWTDGGVASPAPFYWSTGGYAVMCHTFKPGLYDFGSTKDGEVALTHESNYLDMFFMTGDGQDNMSLLRDYYQLTGKPILLPKFGFYEGHLNAYNRDYWKEDDGTGKKAVKFEDGKYYRESQKDNGGIKESLNGENDNYQFSARAVIDRYNAHDMPLGWILPNDGYGAGYGQTETLDGNIANLKSFADYAHGKGVEIGLWTQSQLHPVDTISALLQRDIVKEVRDAGVRVLKTDVAWVGDGYSFGLNGVADVAHIMPYYGNNARPFIISLDGWAGTQRYAGIWSGDQTGGKWEYIRFHIPTYIGAGLSGLGNITSDMDGIFGGAVKDVNIRDFEWKTFTPMQLNMDGWGYAPKYPYQLGEPAASINRSYLKWKSMLLPYSYSCAWEATNGGKPLMRAMFLVYPTLNFQLSSFNYQYMYGPAFLVAPVYQSTAEDKDGNDIRNGIYLPEGEWIDYFTGDTYQGGKIISNYDAPIWKLPVFVRPGAIIPMNLPNNSPSEIDESKLLVEVYPSQEHTEFKLYDDDGKTDAYKDGFSYQTIRFGQQLSGKGVLSLKVHDEAGPYNYHGKQKSLTFIVNSTKRPRKVLMGKTRLREVSTEKELMEYEGTYFYNEAPELNRFSTPDSAFSKMSIKKNPQLWIHASTLAEGAQMTLTVEGVEFYKPVVLATHHGAVAVPGGFAVRPEDNTPYSLTPSWQKVENADYYEIEYEGQIYSTIRNTNLQFGDLKPQTTHSFKVRAVNADGQSDWAALTATTKDNPYELAIKGITGKVNGPVDIDHEVSRLFDFQVGGDIWYDDFAKEGEPYVVEMDLHCTTNVEKLQYVPREGGGNGTLMEGKIEVSLDGKKWKDCGCFNWEAKDTVRTFPFADSPEIRYIRLTINKAKGDFVAGREIYVFRAPGAKVRIPGDINQDNKIDDADLTSYLNYNGLKKGDADYEGYVSKGDLNGNGLIDAYDISEVATKLEGGIHADGKNVAGTISVSYDKPKYIAGDEILITVKGRGLEGVNALGIVLPYSEKDMRFEKVEPLAVGKMQDMTNDRLHTDGTKALYPTFVNIGDKDALSGDKDLFILHFKALRNIVVPERKLEYILVDKFMNYKG